MKAFSSHNNFKNSGWSDKQAFVASQAGLCDRGWCLSSDADKVRGHTHCAHWWKHDLTAHQTVIYACFWPSSATSKNLSPEIPTQEYKDAHCCVMFDSKQVEPSEVSIKMTLVK